MAELDISIIANVSVSAAPATLGFYNPNSLMIVSADTPIEPLTGSYGIYKSLFEVGAVWGTTTNTYYAAQQVFAQSPNILSGGGYLLIAPMNEDETLATSITRLYNEVYFAGVIHTELPTDSEYLAASTAVQGLDCVLFAWSNDVSEFTAETGLFAQISSASNTHTKSLYYGSTNTLDAFKFAAGYASRGMSTDFTAQNSTSTQNLKDIAGIVADTSITTQISTQAASLGVDIYPSIGGLAKVLSNPIAGMYFDDVYNDIWFKKRAQVEFFNALAGTRNKIPQTETGMNYLKSKMQSVCALAVYNGFLAPGTWNSADTFGNPDDFRRNIIDYGYYVYSMPISQQSQTDRQARKAPAIQIAGKKAGAIHGGSVIINFEA